MINKNFKREKKGDKVSFDARCSFTWAAFLDSTRQACSLLHQLEVGYVSLQWLHPIPTCYWASARIKEI